MVTGVTSRNKGSTNMESNLNSNQDWIESTKVNTKTAKEHNFYHRHNLNNSKIYIKHIYEAQKELKKTIPNASKTQKISPSKSIIS